MNSLPKLHPEVQSAVQELERVAAQSLVLTEVHRSLDDSETIYSPIGKRLQTSNGKGLTPSDYRMWEQVKDLSDVGLKQWARLRPSWHKVWAAVDIRVHGIPNEVIALMKLWLKEHCISPMWEVITETHGTGPHIHLARKDFDWLKKFPGSLRRGEEV